MIDGDFLKRVIRRLDAIPGYRIVSLSWEPTLYELRLYFQTPELTCSSIWNLSSLGDYGEDRAFEDLSHAILRMSPRKSRPAPKAA